MCLSLGIILPINMPNVFLSYTKLTPHVFLHMPKSGKAVETKRICN